MTLNPAQNSIESLRAALAQKDMEIARLRDELAAKQEKIEILREEHGTEIKMVKIAKNQELMTLKVDISNFLSLDYADYIASREDGCSEGLFMHYRATLSRIFQVLRRLGIAFE